MIKLNSTLKPQSILEISQKLDLIKFITLIFDDTAILNQNYLVFVSLLNFFVQSLLSPSILIIQ